MSSASRGPRWRVPEVVQSSAMDCGPAALKALLGGFRIPVSYGRLREACQTDVDGTSINAIEDACVQLGLEAEQMVIPFDHLLLGEAQALPAVVALWLPGKLTHFVVAWRRHGGIVQVMDPSTGRRWVPAMRLLQQLYIHEMEVDAADWLDWASSDDFILPFRRRLADLGMERTAAAGLIRAGVDAGGWEPLAGLDASVRMVSGLVLAGALPRGAEAIRAVQSLAAAGFSDPAVFRDTVPPSYWTARAISGETSERVILRGALLVSVRAAKQREEVPALPRSPELRAALQEPDSRPMRDLWRLLGAGGALSSGALLLAVLLAALTVVAEAVLFRAFLDVGDHLALPGQRWAGLGLLIGFLAAAIALDASIALGFLRAGRQLETRLRVAFLHKLPRLGDRYFHSRLTSDMAERSHSVHTVRSLPALAGRLLQILAELFLVVAGLTWIDPQSGFVATWMALLVAGIPLLVAPALAERDLRFRIHTGALTRFILDGLLGLLPIRAHCAERAVRRQHEALLAEWGRAGLGFHRLESRVAAVQSLVGFGGAAWLLWDHLARHPEGAAPLLLAYWALRIPVLGQELTAIARQVPSRRSVTLRLLEPLGAPEDPTAIAHPGEREAHLEDGVALRLERVSVRAGGHSILEDVDLSVEPGAEVAIVGPSGAGKSTLVGMLLGWSRPASGSVRVDGHPLDGPRLARLREVTAWVDPAVQLWNGSLADNLTYGLPPDARARLAVGAELRSVLERLPDGLATPLGDGGGFLSGGEGQRVRLSRAFLRPHVRLAILDEPFRGLDRDVRRELLGRARRLWRGATLLCITHDLEQTLDFGRVLVVEGGRVVEDGVPAVLAAERSRYRALLDAERDQDRQAWADTRWRRLWLEDGRLETR